MEYVIWGVPPGAAPDDIELGLAETVLHTTARTLAEAQRVATILEARHGCTRTRIQTLDMHGDGATVQAAFRAAVR